MSSSERSSHVRWALDLFEHKDAFASVVKERRAAIEESNNRLRGMLKHGQIRVTPHTPDILGCYVLVPGAKR
jgi:hypothetical protein